MYDDRILNAYLGKKEFKDKNYSENDLKSWICCLHNEIKNIHNIKDGTVVYKGVKLKFPSDIGIGSKFYSREFFITSPEKEISESFVKGRNATIMVITILNKCTNSIHNFCCDTQIFSPYPLEKEVIFTSHCSFIVADITHINNIDYISLVCEGFLFD